MARNCPDVYAILPLSQYVRWGRVSLSLVRLRVSRPPTETAPRLTHIQWPRSRAAGDGERRRSRARANERLDRAPGRSTRRSSGLAASVLCLCVWSSAAAPLLLLVVLRPPLVCVRVLSPSLAPLSRSSWLASPCLLSCFLPCRRSLPPRTRAIALWYVSDFEARLFLCHRARVHEAFL